MRGGGSYEAVRPSLTGCKGPSGVKHLCISLPLCLSLYSYRGYLSYLSIIGKAVAEVQARTGKVDSISYNSEARYIPKHLY